MVAITGTIQELTAEGVTAESGRIIIRLVVPVVDEPIISTAPVTVAAVGGVFSFELPASGVGNGYRFQFREIPGLGAFHFRVPDVGSVSLSELIDLHQVDPATFEPVAGAPTVLEEIDRIDAELDLKAPIASPTFTGTVGGVTKAHVGLGNVDNTSDVGKPVSTATQAALDLKQDELALDVDVAALVGDSGSDTATALNAAYASRGPLLSEYAIAERDVLSNRLARRMTTPPTVTFSKGSGLSAVPTVAAGGSGYVVGDVITLAGGTALIAAQVKVATVSAGAVATVTIYRRGLYTATPSNPVAQASTTGSGTGATFTVSSWNVGAGPGGTVEGTSYNNPTDTSRFRFTGRTLTNLSGTGYYGSGVGNDRHSAFEWSTDSRRLDIWLTGLNSSLVLYVDGEQVSASQIATDASGTSYVYAVDLTTPAWRTFKLIGINMALLGVRVDSGATMTSPIRTDAPVAWSLGDSYEGGTGAANAGSTHILTMADVLGLDLISSGVGGSGWNTASPSTPAERVTADLVGLNRVADVDYVFLDLGYNDAGGNMTTAASAFDAAVSAIETAAPDARIICFGPATPQGATANLNLVRDMLIARCAAHDIEFVDQRDLLNMSNEARYVGSDNVHPSADGHRFLGAIRSVQVRPLLSA